MRFHRLAVKNLRAIRQFEVDDLGDFIVIAGPNGCGKSSVFDAIRLLKSVYGGYAANEYQQFFGEFQINTADPQAMAKLFRDPDRPILIEAEISFSDSELTFLIAEADSLVQPIAWQEVTGQPVDLWTYSRVAMATQMRGMRPRLDETANRLAREVRDAIARSPHRFTLSLSVDCDGTMRPGDCRPVEVAFQSYRPDHLGIIEYHSAARAYSRQQVGGINLDARAFEDQQRQSRLYNWQAKYQNVKTELATSYLRSLIAGQAQADTHSEDLNDTLKELFRTFFPDKEYLGVRPQPHGVLEFPVKLPTGEIHDIDELSSGEKEILYGYLRLRNSTPRNSVILLDEPELHLNPGLLQGFADFYYRRLGLDQGNQLWLVTHSDTLLRQAVGNANYRVYQMLPATTVDEPTNQAVTVLADDDVDRATIDLIGELATYRPHGKVVILEGLTEHGFDVNMVRRLFPDFARRVNLVSGGSKRRVKDLRSALNDAADQAGLRNRFFAIVDRDSSPLGRLTDQVADFTWDAYHIENYLLDPGSIRAAARSLKNGRDDFDDDEAVLDALRSCAANLVDSLVMERLIDQLGDRLVGAIDLGGPRRSSNPGQDLLPSIRGSLDRIHKIGDELTSEYLAAEEARHRADLTRSLDDGTWIREVPGRLIIREFVTRVLGGGIESVMFSNLVLDKMVDRAVEPSSMKTILDAILAM